jgi:beta-lactam-binding protein with PASTA domain
LQKEIGNFLRLPLYLFSFVLIGLIFGYLTFKVLSFSRTVEVPDLITKSPLEANRLLTDKGLYLKIEGEDYDSTIATGNILRQDVPAGNKVRERRGIKVVISKGPRIKSVPMLVNESLVNAETLLLQKGLKISRVILVHSDMVEKDRIISQKPAPDEPVTDTIQVIVSIGPYEKLYTCPDFKGMSVEQAQELLKKLNMKANTEGTGGYIESQRPEPGKQIRTGDTIYLKLS